MKPSIQDRFGNASFDGARAGSDDMCEVTDDLDGLREGYWFPRLPCFDKVRRDPEGSGAGYLQDRQPTSLLELNATHLS